MSAQGDFDFRELCVSSTVPRLLRHGTLAGRHAEVPAEHCVYWAVPVARRTTVGSGPFGDDVWRPGSRRRVSLPQRVVRRDEHTGLRPHSRRRLETKTGPRWGKSSCLPPTTRGYACTGRARVSDRPRGQTHAAAPARPAPLAVPPKRRGAHSFGQMWSSNELNECMPRALAWAHRGFHDDHGQAPRIRVRQANQPNDTS